MDLQVKDRAFLVAGGSAGLGLGTATLLAREGARVSICGRDPVRLQTALDDLHVLDPRAHGRALDLRDGAALAAWVDEAARLFGRLDGVLVNAGGPPRGGLESLDDAAWQAAWELNLLSAVRLVRAVRPHLRAAGGGSIVAVTSGSAREPIDGLLLSNVLRPGVGALMKSLSRELAPEGIRCNSLAPGFIDTERLRSLEAAMAAEAGRTRVEQEARLCAEVPLGRYGRVEEFAHAAVFLLAPVSSYLSGVQLPVDGGRQRSG
ncbi:MAG: SDR family oxidoreductase [Candidatus Delongbacteria bacterium]